MADTLESLEIQITSSAKGASNQITNLKDAVHKLGDALQTTVGRLGKFVEKIQELGQVENPIEINSYAGANFYKTVQNVKSAAQAATKGMQPLTKGEQEYAEQAGRAEIAANKLNQALIAQREAFNSGDMNGAMRAQEQILNAQKQIALANQYQETATPVDAETQALIQEATQIDVLVMKLQDLRRAQQEAFASGDMSSAGKLQGQILQTQAAIDKARVAAHKASGALEETAQAMDEVGDAARGAHHPIKNFLSSLKRIAYYRFIRSIIKGITQAFQEGLQKAYIFSSGIDGEGHRFAAALDSMKASSNQLKGQLGAAFAALLTALQPIIEAIINLILKVADAITQLFSAFTGSTYTKAVKTSAKLVDNMKAGGGAAKEWKNQLMGFDEINRLNEPSDGGGGSGSNPLEGYDFSDSPISEFWMKVAQKIKEFYDKIKPIIDDIKLLFSGLIDFIVGVFTGDWDRAFQGLGKILEGFGGLVQHTTELAVELFDLLADNGILSVSKLFDFLEEKTGLDLSKMQYRVVFVLNFIRFLVEEISTSIAETINHLCKAVSAALQGDWETAWNEAAEAVSFKGMEIVDTVYARAREVTDQMVLTDHAVSEHSRSSAREVAIASESMSNSMAGAGNGSAAMAEVVATNMNAVGDAMAQAAGNSISINDTGNTLSFVANVKRIAVGIARVLSGGVFGSGISGKFANGGFPTEGQLFFANEAGAEMVGSIGGRTAVANNQDIVEGIRQGVYDAVVAANGNGNSDVNVRVYLDSREIKAGQQRLARAMG